MVSVSGNYLKKERSFLMWKKGWILLLLLICVAFLVSCARGSEVDTETGELVRIEAVGEIRQPLAAFGRKL